MLFLFRPNKHYRIYNVQRGMFFNKTLIFDLMKIIHGLGLLLLNQMVSYKLPAQIWYLKAKKCTFPGC